MSTTDWRQSMFGKFVSVILTFALSFSFLSLPAYADEAVEDGAPADAVAASDGSADSAADAPDAQPADEDAEASGEDAAEQEAASGTHPAAVPTDPEGLADDVPTSQINEDIALDYVGYAYAGDVIVKVTAPAGVVDMGTQVRATKVDDAAVIEAVDNAMAAERKELADAIALDVELVDADGNVVQPKGSVNVSFFDAAVEGDEFAVYHVSDDARQVQRVSTLQADSNVQSFNVSHFSIYVVGSAAAPTFVTYRFFVPSSEDSSAYPDWDNPSYTQKVQQGDTLLAVPTPSYPGQTLAGWSTIPNPYNLDDCIPSAELFTTVGELSADQGYVDYYAVYTQAVNVSFYSSADESASVIHVATGFNGEAIDTTGASRLVPVSDAQGVAGWSETPGGANKAESGLYPISSNKDIALYPIIETGTVVSFDANTTDMSATYLEPRFVPAGKTYYQAFGEELPVPQRIGYDFAGWTIEGDRSLDEVLGAVQDANVTLLAQWTPGFSSVKVVAYAETTDSAFDATDDEKVYERLIPTNPTDYSSGMFETGSTIDVAANAGALLGIYSYESQNYTVNAAKSTDTAFVSADGTTLVTIYLDRARKTVKLYTDYTEGVDQQLHFAGTPVEVHYVYGQDASGQIPDYVDGRAFKWMSPYMAGAEGTYIVNEWSQVVDKRNLDSLLFNGAEGANEVVLCGLPIENETGTAYYYKYDVDADRFAFDHQAPIFEGVTLSTFLGGGMLSIERFANVAAGVDYTADTAAGADITALIEGWDYLVDTSAPISHEGNVYILYRDLSEMPSTATAHMLSFVIPNANGNGADLYFDSAFLEPGESLRPYSSALNAPEQREGYAFKGWYLDPVYSPDNETYVLSDAVMPDHALTLFGFYVPQAPTVSFATEAVTVDNADNYGVGSLAVEFGQRIQVAELPTVIEDGAIVSQGSADQIEVPAGFAWYGWCLVEGSGFSKFDFSTPVQRSLVLVPYCIADAPYAVEYYVNGQQAKADPAKYNALSTAPVLPFDGESADFVCWSVEKDGTTYHYYPGSTTDQIGIIQTDGVVRMEASFRAELPQVQIVYHSTGVETYEQGEALDANSETTIADYMFKDEPAGRSFIGWSANQNATEAAFRPGDTVVVTTDGAEVVQTDGGLVVACSSLYPVFGYTISYELDGGAYYDTDESGFPVEVFPNPEVYTTLGEDVVLRAPEKHGYDFLGWTGSNGDEPQLEVVIPAGTQRNLEYRANWKVKGGFYFDIRYVNSTDVAQDIIDPIVSDDLGTVFGPYDFGTEVSVPDYYKYEFSIPGYLFHPQSDSIIIDESGNTFVFVCSPIQYSISYDLDGGSLPQEPGASGGKGDTSDTPIDQGAVNPEMYSIASTAAELTLTNPTRPGSDFMGWSVNAYGDYAMGEDGSFDRGFAPVSWGYDPFAVVIDNALENLVDLHIVATWQERDPVTITYKAIGGGSVKAASDATGADGSALVTESVRPYSGEPTGAVAFATSTTRFVGWYAGDVDEAAADEAISSMTAITSGSDYPKELTADLVRQHARVDEGAFGDFTFTAVFAPSDYGDTYVVTYRAKSVNNYQTGVIGLADQASEGAYYEQNQYDTGIHSNGTDGVNARIALPVPGYEGFEGWYVNGVLVSDQSVLDADTIKANVRSYQWGGTTYYTDTVFEARFVEGAPFDYLFFGSEGGTVSESTITVRPATGLGDGSSVVVTAYPDLGYFSDGWYTDPAFSPESRVSDFETLVLNQSYVSDPSLGAMEFPVFEPAGPFYAKFMPDVETSYEVVYRVAGDAVEGGVALGDQDEDGDFYQFVSQRHLHMDNGADLTGATAKANAGYRFAGWYFGDELVTTNTRLGATAVMSRLATDPETGTYLDMLFTARFVEADPVVFTYQVADADQGSVRIGEESGAVLTDVVKPLSGTAAKASAIPAKGYRFAGWFDTEGNVVSKDADFRPERVEGLYAGGTYTARFEIDPTQQYSITYAAGEGGQVSLMGEASFGKNASESFQVLTAAGVKGAIAHADAGYLFDGWYLGELQIADASSASLMPEVVIANLTKVDGAYANATFHARFVAAPAANAAYAIRFVEVVDGQESPLRGEFAGVGIVGESISYTAPSFDGYRLEGDAEREVIITDDPEQNVLTFVYERRDDLSYTVNYYLSGTTEAIADAKEVVDQTYLDAISEDAVSIDGYVVAGPARLDFVVGREDGGFTEHNTLAFYYAKRADLSYTVSYYLADSDEMIAEPKTVTGQTYLDEVVVEAVDVPGYVKPAEVRQTIVIGKDGEGFAENVEARFYYTKRTNLSYTVSYVDAATGNALAPEKVVENKEFQESVTEQAIDIEGYVAADPTSITFEAGVAADGSFVETQAFAFAYDVRTDLSYVVRYVDAEGAELAAAKAVDDQTYGAKVTEAPIAIDGYVCMSEPVEFVIGVENADVVFKYAKRGDLSYAVKHVAIIDGKTVEVAETDVVTDVEFGATVEAAAKEVDGYYLIGDERQSIEITTGENVITFVYALRTDLSYTIRYVDADGAEVADAETVGDQTFGTEPVVSAKAIDGYVTPADQSVRITTGENVVTFAYAKRTDLSYTVSYVEADTSKVLATAETVTGQTYRSEVTVEAIDIAGYDKVAPESVTFLVGVDGNAFTESNAIVFAYTKRTDLSYTVNYLERGAGTDGSDLVLAEPKTVTGQTYLAEATEQAIEIEGYDKPTVASQTITIDVENNVIDFYYTKRTNLSYTVNYLEKATEEGAADSVLAEPKTVSGQTYLAEVTEQAIDIPGYVAPAEATITINVEGNVIDFYYAKRTDLSYTVNYLERIGDEDKIVATPKIVDGQTYLAEVTERAVQVVGYDAAEPAEATIIIGVENNVIDFYYTKKGDLSYTVNYLEHGTGAAIAQAKTVGNQTFKDVVSEQAIAIDGYVALAPTEASITIEAADNVIDFYYAKRTDLSYTVNYLERGAGENGSDLVLAPARTVTGQTYLAEVTEQAIAIDGYDKPAAASQTITINVEGNVIDFYYTKRTDLAYTVNYVEEGTDITLAEAKNVGNQTFKDVVSEQAIAIDGYVALAPTEASITITTGTNVVTFAYAKRTDLAYTVNYVEEGTGAILAEPKTVTGQTYLAEVTEQAIAIDGYDKPAIAEQTITITTGDNAITFAYAKRTNLSYTVSYVDAATGNALAPEKVVENKTYQESVTEQAIDIEGYTVIAPASQTITITTGENAIVFQYQIRTDLSYVVRYVDADGTELAAAKVVAGQTYGTSVTEAPIAIEGHACDMAPASFVIGVENADVVFVYAKRGDLSYTVNYLDRTTGTALAPSKVETDQVFGTRVTEQAIDIDGYTAEEPTEATIEIAESGNVIDFYYQVRTDLSYTIRYVDADGAEIADAETVDGQAFGAELTVSAKVIDGYVAPADQTITITTGENVVTFAYAKRTDLSYTVNYYLQGTTEKVADSKTVANRTYLESVTEQAIDIAGYDKAEPVEATIAITTGENVIDFFYTKRTDLSYTVKYVSLDDNGVFVNADRTPRSIEDVTVGDQTFQATVDGAAQRVSIDGYRFVEATPNELVIGADPERNVLVFAYAKRTDLTYTVRYVDAQGNAMEGYESVTAPATFAEQRSANAPSIEGYVVDAATKTIDVSSDSAANVISFVYEPRTDLSYTIEYVSADGSLEPRTETVGDQVFGDTVTIVPEAVDGYTVSPASQTITIGVAPQTVTFTYAKRTDLGYTVSYLERGAGEDGTDKVLREQKAVSGQTFGTVVSYGNEIQGIDIPGYVFSEAVPETFAIGTDASQNAMALYYVPRADLELTVNYLDVVSNEPIQEPKTVRGLAFGQIVQASEHQADIDGYRFDSADSEAVTIGVGTNVLNLFYAARTDISYTIKYLLQGTSTPVRAEETVTNKTFGEEVSISAPEIPGYVLVSASPLKATLQSSGNEFVFEYERVTGLTYTVQYLVGSTVVKTQTITGEGEGFAFGDVVEVAAEVPAGYVLAEGEAATKEHTIGADSAANLVSFAVAPRTDLSYTVNYLEITGDAIPGVSSKTVTGQTFGSTVEESAIEIMGYEKPAQATQALVIGVEGNVIDFYYTKVTGLGYTVRYVVGATGEELGTKTVEGKTFGESVTEHAEAFPGYTASSATFDFTIGMTNPDVVFYYTPNDDIVYTVRYVVAKGDGLSAIAEDKVVTGQTMATTITEAAIVIPGYTVSGDASQSLKLAAVDNVITFVYTPNTDIAYTVRYLERGTDEPVADERTETGQTMASPVTEHAIEVEGYVLDSAETQTITLGASGNEIVFYYVPRTDLSYTVHYQDAAGAEIHESTTVGDQTFGSTVEVLPLDINGYISPASQTITIGVADNTVTFVYEPLVITGNQSYTVRHVFVNGEAAADDETFEGLTAGDEVVVNAKQIRGYAADQATKALTIVDGENIVVFRYAPDFSDIVVRGYAGTYDAAEHGVYVQGTILDDDEVRYTLNGVGTSNAFRNAGTYQVDVTVSRCGQSITRNGVVRIDQAPLTITTNSAVKQFDGHPLTAGGSITGLIGGESVTFRTTGSQTWWGSSANTYELIWDGTANPANYYLHAEGIGTLTVRLFAVDPGETPTDPDIVDRPIDQPSFGGQDPAPEEPTTGILTGAQVNQAQSSGTGRIERATSTQAQVNVPVEQIDENDSPLAAGTPGGEFMPGFEGITIGDLSGKAIAIAILTIAGIALTALYTLFAVGRRRRFMNEQSGLDDLR